MNLDCLGFNIVVRNYIKPRIMHQWTILMTLQHCIFLSYCNSLLHSRPTSQFYLYISDNVPSREPPPRDWSQQKWLQLSLFRHFPSTCSILCLPTLYLQYSLTLLIHFTKAVSFTPLPSILLSHSLFTVILMHSNHVFILSKRTMQH